MTILSFSAATAGEIILSGSGSGQWQVNATGLSGVHALDLVLRYDPLRLPGLTATSGSGLTGAMAAINDKVPGVIRLGAASTQPLASSGTLLKLQSGAAGAELVVSSFTVKTVDEGGKVVPTTVRHQIPAPSSPQPAADPLTETVTPATPPLPTSGRGGSGAGSVTLPVDVLPSEERRAAPLPPTSPDNKEALATDNATDETVSAASGPEKRFHSQEAIVTAIERLPQPWTIAAIKAIFLQPATGSQVRQLPPVILADGKSRVSLFLPKSLSRKIPTIGVQGCTLGAIWDANELDWEVEIFSIAGIWPAKALLLGEGDLIQFPVVIVPPLTFIPPTKEQIYIPSVDFDGDTAITALDAYLYVGNLLAQ